MTGSDRRNAIVEQIRKSAVPVPGRNLAAEFDVSRQVIVQDIALIRAAGYDIISTNRGYIINEPHTVSRVFKVKHTDEQLEEELNAIVDLGENLRCDRESQGIRPAGSRTQYYIQKESGGVHGGYQKWKIKPA